MKYNPRPRVQKYRPVQKKRRPNAYFRFKRFTVWQDQCGMKITTDACLFGGVVAEQVKNNPPRRVLDIGTGTGVLSMMMAQTTEAIIDAVELDRAAWMQASANFSQSAWNDRLNAHFGPIQSFKATNFEDMGERYDLIICNPPFFKNHLRGEEESRNRALHNNDLPLEDVLEGLQKFITPTGLAYVLLPYHEMINFSGMMEEAGFHEVLEMPLFTQPGKPVFRTIKAFSPSSAGVKHKENVVIKDPDQVYTWRFSSLMKDFYMNMKG